MKRTQLELAARKAIETNEAFTALAQEEVEMTVERQEKIKAVFREYLDASQAFHKLGTPQAIIAMCEQIRRQP